MAHSTKLKYPPKVMFKEVKGMLKTVRKDKDIVFIGTLFEAKEYSRYSFNKITKRFTNKIRDKKVLRDNPDYILINSIVSIKKKIAEIIEARIVTKTGINPVFKMFLLKCCHKWIEEEKRLGLKINIKQETSYTINLPQQLDAKKLGNKPIEIAEDGSIKQ